jgi:lipid II:glycine glycyltransferase (peptidoglycan interpeptide bridge formation enzyme)
MNEVLSLKQNSTSNFIDDWNNFLLSTSESNFFCSSDYWDIYKNAHVIVLRNNENKIIAGVPFCFHSVSSFFKICRLESSVLVADSVTNTEKNELKEQIFNNLITYLKTKKTVYLFISSKSRSNDISIFNELEFITSKSGTYILNLEQDENEIYKSFSKGHKSSIQKAQKCGLDIKILEGKSAIPVISDYCKIQDKLFERKKESFLSVYLKSESLLTKTLNSKYCKTFLAMAYYNGEPAASAFLVSFNKTIYYYAGASDYNLTRQTQASNILHFEIIKYAKSNGFTQYDFGGAELNIEPTSDMYGVYSFKKHFGGAPFEYDCGSLILNHRQYRLMKMLGKYSNLLIFRGIVSLFKK